MSDVDFLGTLGLIDPEKVISSASLVKRGRVVSLGQTYEAGMPQIWFHGPFFAYTYRTVEDSLRMFKEFENHLGSTICRYELSDHTGTHVDGLNHASTDHELHGGIDIRDITADVGTTEMGIESMPPVFTRGILLDFPDFFGVDMLEPGYEIKEKDISDYISRRNVTIRKGDGIFFRTGYGKLWMKDNEKYMGDAPGPGEEAARWLLKNHAGITGADTSPYEVTRENSGKKLFPCHQILIKEGGMHLVENMRLEELSSDSVSEFLFLCLPLKLKGGAGSPVSPAAVY